MIILAPLLGILGLMAVPFISVTRERSVRKRPWAVGIVLLVVASVGALWREGTKEPWTPKFSAKPLTEKVIGAQTRAVYNGARVFNNKGCLYCHIVAGHGGQRGPDLTYVSERLTHNQIVIRIINGGNNMPAYAGNITPEELNALTDFLEERRSK